MADVIPFDRARALAEIKRVVGDAVASGQPIPARIHARNMTRLHPESEMSEEEIVQRTLRQALWGGLPIDTAY